MKIGDTVKILPNWREITAKLDGERVGSGISAVGTGLFRTSIGVLYVIEDIDEDGDINIGDSWAYKECLEVV